jgi:hypothetical protein
MSAIAIMSPVAESQREVKGELSCASAPLWFTDLADRGSLRSHQFPPRIRPGRPPAARLPVEPRRRSHDPTLRGLCVARRRHGQQTRQIGPRRSLLLPASAIRASFVPCLRCHCPTPPTTRRFRREKHLPGQGSTRTKARPPWTKRCRKRDLAKILRHLRGRSLFHVACRHAHSITHD